MLGIHVDGHLDAVLESIGTGKLAMAIQSSHIVELSERREGILVVLESTAALLLIHELTDNSTFVVHVVIGGALSVGSVIIGWASDFRQQWTITCWPGIFSLYIVVWELLLLFFHNFNFDII